MKKIRTDWEGLDMCREGIVVLLVYTGKRSEEGQRGQTILEK